jgi:hypothetical protein
MIPEFNIISTDWLYPRSFRIDVSDYESIRLVNAKTVASNPKFEYALALPLFGGILHLFPNNFAHYRYFLDGEELKLPTGNIKEFYTALYTTLHKKYTESILDELG